MTLKVEDVLRGKGIDFRLIKLSQVAFTVDDVAKYSQGDINIEETCKTIVLSGKKTKQKIAVLLRGRDKVNFSAAKKLIGEEMNIANAEEVKEVAGVDPGAVCPFMLSVPLFVDKHVLALKKINCGSGDHLHGLEFETADLARAVQYREAALSKELVTNA